MSNDSTKEALLRASRPASKALFAKLIAANHILHYHHVVDAFGHISFRNPQDSRTFFMSKSLAPALISDRADIEEYRVSDGSPVNPDAPKGYAERFIHSEIYKKYRGVQCVVHSHAEAVIPFSIGSVPLRPVLHMAGVMGARVPIYDIGLHYKSSDELHSMLVSNEHLGAALAAGLNPSTGVLAKGASFVKNLVTSAKPEEVEFPPCATILMRGHGFTCVGVSIEDAVYRAVYTTANARIQTTALLMQGTFNVGRIAERFAQQDSTDPAKYEDIKYLSERECKDTFTAATNLAHCDRPWKLWCAEIEHSGLYRNELSPPPEA